MLDLFSSHLRNLHFNNAYLSELSLSSTAPAHPLLPVYLGLLFLSILILNARKQIYLLARFAYSCFLAPIGKSGQQKDRLDKFYSTQASIYDATRTRLLKGREEMLRLTAAHLEDQIESKKLAGEPEKKLVWVDIGGGTGEHQVYRSLVTHADVHHQAIISKPWTSSSRSTNSMLSSW